jgi:hypothetical protein
MNNILTVSLNQVQEAKPAKVLPVTVKLMSCKTFFQ